METCREDEVRKTSGDNDDGVARLGTGKSQGGERSVTCQGHLDQQVGGLHPDIQHPGAGEG